MPVTYRKDYKPAPYTVEHVDLWFDLDPERTIVKSHLRIVPRDAAVEEDLHLHGEELELLSIEVPGGKRLEENVDFKKKDEGDLVIYRKSLPEKIELQICNAINPSANTELSGLYKAGELLCTQCEAEGFRRITYFVDRPDSLGTYRVSIRGDKEKYPTILSNGDEVERKDVDGGRHELTFVDSVPKPSYLFALVAGPMALKACKFTTMNGDSVSVEVYAAPEYIERTQFALDCAIEAMKFDEAVFGRAYDLATYRIVCIENFNAGAMENKSLTTYNVASILASQHTADDRTYQNICSTIGHEYFHNWSGDRITIRDWFQIALKEGFTSVREQMFMESLFSRACIRISNVQTLRAIQFPEDAGPMAHSVRPDSYECIDNFYTATVYEKGAEVFRMFRTVLGDERFRKGCDLYFDTFDGKGVSCTEFIWAMGEAAGEDLSQMENWYAQAGTPTVVVEKREWNSEKKTYCLKLRQVVPKNALPDGQTGKPYLIPVKYSLVGLKSKTPVLSEGMVLLTEESQSWTFEDVKEDAIPSIMRDFSAPVRVEDYLTLDEMMHLATCDSDPFVVWDMGQSIYRHFLLELSQDIFSGKTDGQNYKLPEHVYNCVRRALEDNQDDLCFLAQCITLPPLETLLQLMKPVADPPAIIKALRIMRREIAGAFEKQFDEKFRKMTEAAKDIPFEVDQKSIGRRALQNVLLSYLCDMPAGVTMDDVNSSPKLREKIARAAEYLENANCYNDKECGFRVLLRAPTRHPIRQKWAQRMYDDCKGDANLIDEWVAAVMTFAKSIQDIREILEHPDVKGTTLSNRFRSVVRGIYRNQDVFHADDGSGYMLLAERLAAQDSINGYVTAGATKLLLNFSNYTEQRKNLMKAALQWMADNHTLSKVTAEVVKRGLAG